MTPIILEKLAEIESRHKVKILCAMESGSRAWGFPSPDSDYDARFIFAHSRDTYLGFLPYKDELGIPVDEVLDIKGWDLRKAIELAMKRNVTPYEWLQSPIIYREVPGFREELFRLLSPGYSPIGVVYHYVSQARNSMESGLSGDEVKMKKYFYVLRALLSAQWAAERHTVAPMEFRPLLAQLAHRPDLLAIIEELLELKKTSTEKTMIPVQAPLQEYIHQLFDRLNAVAKSLPAGNNDGAGLSEFFIRTVSGV
jgi:predicted nucleotidyltransferase